MPNHSTSTRTFLRTLTLLTALTLAGCGTLKPPSPATGKPGEPLRPVTFAELPAWESDDLRAAWPVFLASCDVLIKRSGWQPTCVAARTVDATDQQAIRRFFEAQFIPYQLLNPDGSDTGLATGYYEPLLKGARRRGGRFQTPLLRKPNDLLTVNLSGVYPELKGLRLRGRLEGHRIVPYLSRAEITQSKKMTSMALLWVDDPVDAFFLQVQGSGRIRLADTGETVRVAYADTNGYPYRSIGRYLVDRGELMLEQASAQGIKTWLAKHPSRLQELLNVNPSYVFFREEKLRDPRQGPKGALGVPLTPQRSIAVDPQFVPLGAPVFIATTQPNSRQPLRQLVMAQDTGSAIKGAVRADYFWGSGTAAGEQAGRMKQRASMWVLLPKQLTRQNQAR